MSKWSDKYKKSIDCSNPKGFSQKAHCAGRKKRSLKEAGRPYSAKYMKALIKAGQGKTADTVNVKIPKSGHFIDEADYSLMVKPRGRRGVVVRKPGSGLPKNLFKTKSAFAKVRKEPTLKKEDGPCWDTHKQVGMKMKKGRRVPNCVPKNEDAPTVSAGTGQVAGIGVGPDGEPGVPVKRKKKKLMPFIMYMKRKNV